MYNKVILIGYLTRDVDFRYSASGMAIAKFGLATNRVFKDKITGQNKQETMFIDITVFGRSAEVANQYLKKGKKVLVEGRLVLETWTDNTGQKRSKHSIVAESIKFMDSKSDEFDSYDVTSQPVSDSFTQPSNLTMQKDDISSTYQQPQQSYQPNTDLPEVDVDNTPF